MLVLASRSPRRQDILKSAGIPFTVRPAEVDETPLPHEDPRAYVLRLAAAKARAVESADGDIVLGADTVVVVDGSILGKPTNPADAARMLESLSGRVHTVLTGVCLRSAARELAAAEATAVRFLPRTAAEIREYIASGEPMDKAGAYAIQGLASRFIDRIEGCYFNVVGLPISLVFRLHSAL